MNRTQKAAWFGLAAPCFCIGVWFWCATQVPGIKNLRALPFLIIAVFLLFLTIMFFVMRRKQSAGEVAADERDNMIRAKAVKISFVSVLVMLPVLAVFAVWMSNDEWMVNVFIVPEFTILILFMSMVVYSVAMLVQYGRCGASEIVGSISPSGRD